jgi:hypothetical protein
MEEFVSRFEIGSKVVFDAVEMTVLDVEVEYAKTLTEEGDQTIVIKLSDGYRVLGPVIKSRSLCAWFDNYKVFHEKWLPTQCLSDAS